MTWLVACSNESVPNEVCPITVDSVSIVDSKEVESVVYYLVYRVSGWNDKTEILELYDAKPIFDLCANSDKEPIFGDSLALSQKVKHVYLNTQERTLEIEYTEVPSDHSVSPDFKIELR